MGLLEMQKIVRIFNIGVLVVSLLVPLGLFLNRFLIPDTAYDTINYHLFLGYSALQTQNNKFEFYPAGIHNFSPVLEIPGSALMKISGYRWGSIGSTVFLYLSVLLIYLIFRLYQLKLKVLDCWWWGLMFGSAFLSFEAFLQIATYFVDIEVAFWSLLGCYLLLKYEKNKNIWTLVSSAIVLSLLFWGKMTSGYILPAYFGFLVYVLVTDKKLEWQKKIGRLILAGALVVSLSVPSWYQNYRQTGNPVFPYYNSIFKSNFFPTINFVQEEAGGTTLLQRLFWGLASIKYPDRLGQVHNLFNDYKISIYFILALVILGWSWVKKDKELVKLSVFYLLMYEIWGLLFGYLRYGIFLEFLGGVILLIWMTKLTGLKKYLIILPILGIMLFLGKRIINYSLAYDLSFRPGYFYNRFSYFKETANINNNMIAVNSELVNKYRPKVYLNCATPDLGYQVMSNLAKLPVLNIDQLSYSGMTDNQNYIEKSRELLKKEIPGKTVNFVTITTTGGLDVNDSECLANLKSHGYKISEEEGTNFLGYQGQKLNVIFGEFSW